MTADGRRVALSGLLRACEPLGVDELKVLGWIAQRLAQGEQEYGRLDLASDRRDFVQERSEEIADMLIYSGMAELRRALGKAAK